MGVVAVVARYREQAQRVEEIDVAPDLRPLVFGDDGGVLPAAIIAEYQ
jgi:hypothetical protein